VSLDHIHIIEVSFLICKFLFYAFLEGKKTLDLEERREIIEVTLLLYSWGTHLEVGLCGEKGFEASQSEIRIQKVILLVKNLPKITACGNGEFTTKGIGLPSFNR